MEMLQMTEPGRSSLVADQPEGYQQQTQPTASITSFSTQANALMRKNATFQKRNWKTNACLIFFPLFICILLVVMQTVVNHLLNASKYRCGCQCVYVNSSTCTKQCGLEYSTQDQAPACPISSPTKYPAVLQVPRPEYRAVNDDMGFSDLPDKSCRSSNSCPVTFLYTGQNQSLAETITGNMLNSKASGNLSDALNLLSKYVPGTGTWTASTNFLEPAFFSDAPLYLLQSNCSSFTAGSLANLSNLYSGISSIECLATEILWRNSSAIIDDETYHGYRKSNSKGYINEISAAYDFQDTTLDKLNVIISYNATFRNDSFGSAPALVRASRSMNLVAQAFLRSLQGPDAQLPLWFVKEMPKRESRTRLDFTSLLGPLFFMWVIQLLFPVVLTSLVYEKQNNLRIMMKMHGLGDTPYWVISYGYFLVLSIFYMFCFVLFGSVVDLKIFRLNSYGIQLIFYLVTVNLQIIFGFFVATRFSSVRTATVCGYLYVFGSGLLGRFLFQFFLEDKGTGRGWIFAMELIPAFSLYRGLYEFGQYSYIGYYQGTAGMQWKNMNDHENGMKQILGIMLIESFLLLPLAYYLDQVTASGNGLKKHPLFFLKRRSTMPLLRLPSFRNQISQIDMHVEHADVAEERAIVEGLRGKNDASYAIVCDDLRKKYPGKDGNMDKLAVSGLSLAIKRGECFGMLGPNGAGKTTSINMMIGFLTPTSGTAQIEGLDIAKDLDKIYACMGVCPQHDLIWETLTGEEHLLFYGRLKNLNGAALKNAVETSLKSVNLYKKGVRDKQAGKYSGGMKRRLSVAISLIGNPKVVYMDEPSTGLDPASRNNLWNVIKQAKQERAIILTTHSMEEAEALCDRLGIFVNGQLQCIGNAKELRARYGGTYVLTITTPSSKEEMVVDLVKSLSSEFKKVYGLSGTQKFEMPKSNLRIANVFRAVERNKEELMIQAWGLTDTTLEDVFIKVAVQSSAETSLP